VPPGAEATLPLHRPSALANERLQIIAACEVVLELKTASPGGATQHAISRLEFTQRLFALAPRPRLQVLWVGLSQLNGSFVPKSLAGNAASGRYGLVSAVGRSRSTRMSLGPSGSTWRAASSKVDRAFDSREEHDPALGGSSVGREIWLLANRVSEHLNPEPADRFGRSAAWQLDQFFEHPP
jgi:hypothetical protein